MPIREAERLLCFVRLEISPDEIPDLIARHARNYPGAAGLERKGRELIVGGFEPNEAVAFVQAGGRWGGGDRQMGRVRANNMPAEVATALREAVLLSQAGHPAQG